jgi:hypothetical protein
VNDEIGTAPSAPVVVSYELTHSESISFWRWHISRLYRLRLAVCMAVLVLASGIVLLFVAPIGLAVLVLGLGVAQLLMYGWLYFLVPERAWKSAEESRSPLTLSFSDEGVGVHTNNTDAQNRWPVYSEALERDGMYLLRLGKRKVYTIVPTRAFLSSSDEQRFRALIGRHTSASF